MPAIWPAALPSLTRAQAFREIPGVQTLRTEMDEGPAKTRRLPTSQPDRLQIQQLYTVEETQTMDTFYLTTLAGGALSFESTHPRTSAANTTFRFIGRPQYTHRSGRRWICQFVIEVLP